MAETAIIGGGISGLATAYFLEQNGAKDIILLEAGAETGGKLKTRKTQHYLIEEGPDAYVAAKPVIGKLIEKLDLQQEVIAPQHNTFFIYSGKKLQEVPAGLSALVPADIGAFLRTELISWQGKIRLVLERLVPSAKGTEDESLAAFIERRFGREMLQKLAGPLFAGIHAGGANELSLEASFPQFRKMEKEFGSITKAVLTRRKQNPTPPPIFHSFKNGMQTLPDAIRQHLKQTSVIMGAKVRSIAYFRDKWHIQTESTQIEAEKVILAVPAFTASEILSQLDKPLSAALGSIRHSSSTIITFGFRQEQVQNPLKGTGFLVPAPEQENISAVTFSSAKWAGRAAQAHVLFRAFLNKNKKFRKTDTESIMGSVQKELSGILGIEGVPELTDLRHWANGQPVYDMEHLQRVNHIETLLLQHPGIHVTGASYRGAGIADCVRQAKEVAEKVSA
ncbi:MAG: protoporphyrinogen oxidase [Bacteroidia bacterium]